MIRLNFSHTIIAANIERYLCKQLNQLEIVWLNDAITLLTTSQDKINDLLDLSAVVNRTFTSHLQLSHTFFSTVTTAEIIRILLIKIALNVLTHTEQEYLLKQYYRGADESEKMAWLKGLLYVDEQGVALNTVINASRCNSLNEFSALALNNDYVAQYFPELNFNQLVLKSLFMGLNISCISTLSSRLNARLTNMCFAYAIEQALANRIPPASIWLAILPDDLNDEHSPLITQYLNHFYQQDDNHKQRITWYVEYYQLKNIIIS
jgi:hypothetical protein